MKQFDFSSIKSRFNSGKSVEELHKLEKYYKHSSFSEHIYVKLALLVILISTCILSVNFLVKGFNLTVQRYDASIKNSLETIKQRYELSETLLDTQLDYNRESLRTEAELERLYLRDIPRLEWHSGIDKLAGSDDASVEFYYYNGLNEALCSSNAKGLDLSSDQLQTLYNTGTYEYSGSVTNLYAALPVYDGMLIAMHRDIGVYSAENMRSFYANTQNTGFLNMIIYNPITGQIYSFGSSDWSSENISDSEYALIFDNLVPIGITDSHYSLKRIIRSLQTCRSATIRLNDYTHVTAYYSIKSCFTYIFYEAILPVICFVLISTVLAGGAFSMHILRYQVRLRSEVIHIHKDLYIDKLIIRRTTAMLGIMFSIMVTVIIYITALTNISRENLEAAENLGNIYLDEESSEAYIDKYTEIRDSDLRGILDKAIRIIEADNALCSNEGLAKTAALIPGCNEITLYNSAGISVASSSGFVNYSIGSYDNSDVSSRFRQLLSSEQKNLLTAPDEKDISCYASKTKLDSGLIKFTIVNNEYKDILERFNESSVLVEADFGNADVLYYNASDPDTLLLSEVGADSIKKINNTLPDEAFHDNHFGMATLRGKRFFVNLASDKLHKGNYFISAWHVNELIGFIRNMLLYFSLCCLAVYLMVLLLLAPFCVKPENILDIDADKLNPSSAADDNAVDEDDSEYASKLITYNDSIDILGKYFISSIRWMIRGLIVSFILYIILGILTGNNTGSLVNYLFNAKIESGVNIFTFTIVLLTLLSIWIIAMLLIKIISVISVNSGPIGLTVGKLAISFVKFLSLIIAIILVLSEIGVKTSSILAGAGFTSIVFGIGAQSTLSNIISGLFIIFEGHFHVGDIVRIDDWLGVIKEIGVRTMCLESFGSLTDYQNLRVINNSDFTNITNLSHSKSLAYTVITVPFDSDIELTKHIFDANIDKLRAAMPEIIDGPYFDGITEYGPTYKKLRFRATCSESNRPHLNRKLLQNIGKLLEENHIIAAYNPYRVPEIN